MREIISRLCISCAIILDKYIPEKNHPVMKSAHIFAALLNMTVYVRNVIPFA